MKTRGFTLLELLVAVSLTVAVVGMLLAVTLGVLRSWSRQRAGHEQAAAAARVLDAPERDLSAALWRSDGACWFAADVLDSPASLANHGWVPGSAVMKPASGGSLQLVPVDGAGAAPLMTARFGLSGVWLRFVTTNVESDGGLPIVVAYQLVRRPVIGNPVATNAAPVRYALYRSAISNSETFANGYDVAATAYGSTSNTPSSAVSTAYRSSRNVTNPSHANLLASNVVDFGCWCYVRDGSGALVRIFPADATDLSHRAAGAAGAPGARMPEVVDVAVRVLGEAGVTTVAAIERGRLTRPAAFASDAAWWWSVVESESQVFVRRVEIKAAGR